MWPSHTLLENTLATPPQQQGLSAGQPGVQQGPQPLALRLSLSHQPSSLRQASYLHTLTPRSGRNTGKLILFKQIKSACVTAPSFLKAKNILMSYFHANFSLEFNTLLTYIKFLAFFKPFTVKNLTDVCWREKKQLEEAVN